MRKHTIIIAFMAALLLSVSPMSLTEAQMWGGQNDEGWNEYSGSNNDDMDLEGKSPLQSTVDEAESKTETKETSDQYGKTTITATTGLDPSAISSGSDSSTGTAGSASAEDSGSTGTASGSAADKDKKDDANKKDETQYTGVFNERQIIPNTMAIYCKTNAEDMLKESSKLYNCINDIARSINDKDSSVRAENLQRFSEIRYEELKTMMAQAIAKGAAISNYENIQNELGDATGKTKTEHEDNVAIANATSTLTDVINTMRDLYAERLKNEAISGIQSIDPKVIKDIAEQESAASGDSDKKDEASGASTAKDAKKDQESTSTKITVTENNPNRSVAWKDGNNCSQTVCTGSEDDTCHEEVITCPDNVYPINGSAGTYMVCMRGECKKYEDADMCDNGTLQEQSGSISNWETGMCGDSECPAGIYNVSGRKVACYNGSCTVCLDEVVVTAKSK